MNKRKKRIRRTKQQHSIDQKKQKKSNVSKDEQLEILKSIAEKKPKFDQNLNNRPIPSQGMRRGNR